MSRSALAVGVRHLRGKMAAQQRREDSDEQLLEAFLARRDESAFAVLVRRHGPMVLHVCRRVLGHEQDAEDAFQATFLVLARLAARLRKQSSLSSWLHGIAYRIAMKTKQSAARRRRHERQIPPRPHDEPSLALLWDEVRTLLDYEIARLPEKHRSVFVLFYLEGLGREETARRLGLKEGTVASRMAEARKRLQRRLAGRGLELTAVLAAAAVTMPPASAFSPLLIASTIHAATAIAAGEGIVGLVPLAVAELAKGAVSAAVSKTKIAVAVMLTATLLGGAGIWLGVKSQAALGERRDISPPVVAQNGGFTPPRPKESAKTVEIHGRILGPDGRPRAGAKLLLLGYEDKKVKELGTSEADGRFSLVVPKDNSDHAIIAQADGAGIDFLNLREWKSGKPIELRLVHDQVIRGRVLNTEGKPVAGVRVAINSINSYAKSSLDSFLTAWKERDIYLQPSWGEKAFWSKAGTLLPTTTDAEGRFALHNAGAERLVSLRLSGAGIADTEAWIVNRAGFDPKSYNQGTQHNIPKNFEISHRWVLHGPSVSIVADTEKPIRGRVKDAHSGKGRANVVVYLMSTDENQHLNVELQARTDAAGHYELHGVHKAGKYMLEVEGDASAAYMPSQVWADDTAGYGPITVDIPVKKGVIITGKVIDWATGKSVPGFALAGVLRENPFVKAYPEFNSSRIGKLDYTAQDATFRIVTVPGPVLLMGGLAYGRIPGGLAEMMMYKPVAPDPKYSRYFQKRSEDVFLEYLSFEGGSAPVEGNFCKVLDIKPGTDVVKQDIVLERASALTVIIQDASGRPLTGVWAKGISSERWRNAIQIEKDTCSVYHLQADKPRSLVFFHPERKLAASLTLNGVEKPPVVIKLGPAGAIKGRLLDASGNPLVGALVEICYREREAGDVHQAVHKTIQIITDATGAFTFDELIPDRKFGIQAIRRGKRYFDERGKPREPIVHEVKSSECRDLGDLKVKPLSD
jgi:RNA polymerase sigma factor (sigma-70 family)